MQDTVGFRVETSREVVLLIGPDTWLRRHLENELVRRGLLVLSEKQFSDNPTPPDYCLLLPDHAPLSPGLHSVLSTTSARVVEVLHHSRVGESPTTPAVIRLVFSDVIGANFSTAHTLEKLLDEASRHGTLTLPAEGVADYHLLSQEDLLEGTLRALSSSNPDNPTYLVNPSGLSLLTLAHLIRSYLSPAPKLFFAEEDDWIDFPFAWPAVLSSQRAISWTPGTEITPVLESFIRSYRHTPVPPRPPAPALPTPPAASPAPKKLTPLFPSRPSSPPPPPAPPQFVPLAEPRSPHRPPSLHLKPLRVPSLPRPRPLGILGTGLLFALLLYFVVLVSASTITALSLKSFASSLATTTLPSRVALNSARLPAVFLEAHLVVFSKLPLASRSQPLQTATSLSTAYRHGLESLVLAHDLADTSAILLEYVLGSGEGDLTGMINLARLQSAELYESLSLLDGSLTLDAPPGLPADYQPAYLNLKSNLHQFRSHTLTAKALLAVAPDLLGVGDRRKYLVLFQNNMELRPTGGFIGSFALTNLENGQLYDFQVYDVYAADGQLKGHVEPPAEIKEHLGEANWYLRDSNWDPDFPTSARRAEWFLQKTLEHEVQGTIAVNVNTLADLLDALGPVTIPDYNESITSENIFERAEYHAEVNFFPGSTQKKEFLSSIANTLFQRLSEVDIDTAIPVARALAKSIDEKNTLLAIDTDTTNHALSTLGWNGELRSPACPDLGGECLSDYAMLVDSNFGINKANYFLRRELELQVTIDADRELSHLLKATYQNTATSGSWPAGPYKSYSRVYLPSGAIFDTLKIDGKRVPQGSIDLSAEHGRTVVGYLLQVPVSSTVPVELAYSLPHSLAQSGPTYSFFWQKQPGTSADPLKIFLNYPIFLEPEIISPQAKLNSQQLEFNLTNVTDRRVTVKFR